MTLVSSSAMLLLAGSVTTLSAQGPRQGAALTPVVTSPAPAPAPAAEPATPAPRPSPLFERADADAPTLAAAQQAHEEAVMRQGRHSITVTTTVLVLSVIILVLLIA